MKKTANNLPEEQIGLFDNMPDADQIDLPEEEI
jgi:hypothetical protein